MSSDADQNGGLGIIVGGTVGSIAVVVISILVLVVVVFICLKSRYILYTCSIILEKGTVKFE